MKAPGFVLLFLTGILITSPAMLRAQLTDATDRGQSPVHRLQAPQGVDVQDFATAANPGIVGAMGVLTEQQRASFDTAMEAERPRLAQLQNEARVARQSLFMASITNKFDENLTRQKAMAVARLDAEMIVARMRAFSKVQPPLTTEQIQKIEAAMPNAARPLGRPPLERAPRRDYGTDTNRDENGLPPKH